VYYLHKIDSLFYKKELDIKNNQLSKMNTRKMINVFIPRVQNSINQRQLVEKFIDLGIGNISDIDLRRKMNESSLPYQFAFIEVELFDTPIANNMLFELNKYGKTRYYYESPYYWEIKKFIPRDERANCSNITDEIDDILSDTSTLMSDHVETNLESSNENKDGVETQEKCEMMDNIIQFLCNELLRRPSQFGNIDLSRPNNKYNIIDKNDPPLYSLFGSEPPMYTPFANGGFNITVDDLFTPMLYQSLESYGEHQESKFLPWMKEDDDDVKYFNNLEREIYSVVHNEMSIYN
jgi:hypothetical protein